MRNYLLLAATCCLLAACDVSNPAPSPSVAKPVAGRLTFSVATSTKEVMELLATRFTEKSEVPVQINPGPTSTLANQIISGAPADLFLSANSSWAAKIAQAKQSNRQVRLLTNRLVLIVPQGNPAEVTSPADLLGQRVGKIALAGENVPAGMYADQALAKLNLASPLLASGKIARGQDVRSALGYVQRGEAEVGIVYATDVAATSGVEVVHEFDPTLHDEIVYVLVLLEREEPSPAAEALFEFLQSEEAFDIYEQAGFLRATH